MVTLGLSWIWLCRAFFRGSAPDGSFSPIIFSLVAESSQAALGLRSTKKNRVPREPS